MSRVLLTINAGSSSVKFAVFEGDTVSTEPVICGKIAGIGNAPIFTARDKNGALLDKGMLETLEVSADHDQVIARLLPWLETHHGQGSLAAVGHRVVHGGRDFTAPERISDEVLHKLETLAPLAPLHQPHNIAAIRAVANWKPNLPQIACFDTGFHHDRMRLAKHFALPRTLTDAGIIRYGFHGLSYDHIASVLPEHLGAQADGRIIVAHLGNGASMCAMKDRKSHATTMGFTALDGLMMGRRCGTLDPGVVLYLMQSKGMQAAEIEKLLYKKSGLLGVSGLTNDMQVLQNSDDPHAKDAIALYCYRAASGLAGLVPSIGGLDAVVFTAGIGENSALVRRQICDQLDWLDVMLDDAANTRNEVLISTAASKVKVLVIPTNEELVVAKACRNFLS